MLLCSARLDALRLTGLLDSPAEEAFDRLTRLASSLLAAPISLLTLVDGERQFIKSSVGLTGALGSPRSAPLDYSFCPRVVEAGEPVILPDLRAHPLHGDNRAIGELGVGAYLGVPLRSQDGQVLGALCVFDVVPRAWTDRDVQALTDLAGVATTEVAHRQETAERQRLEEEALRRSRDLERERLQALFEDSPAFVAWCRGPRHVLEGANRAYYQLVGSRELIGRTVDEALPETAAHGLLVELDRVLATGVPFVAKGMRMVLTPNGEPEERYVNFVFQPMREPDGTPSGVFCHGVDVTEQVNATLELQRSDAYHRQLLDSLPVIVYQAEPAPPYETIYVNGAVEALGYTLEEWLTRPDMWEHRLHPDDRARMRREARESYSSATPMDSRYRLLAKDGTVHWFHDRGEFVPDRTGERCIWQGIMLDITGQRAAEEALQESENRYRHIVAHAPGMVYQWVYRPDGTAGYTFVSEGAQTMLGVDPEEALRDPEALLSLIPDEDRPRLREMALEAAMQSGSFHWEGRVVLRSGEERYIEIGARDQRRPDGTILSDGIVVDVTERHLLEQQLRQAQKMEAVGRLAGGVAHDFNNLVTIIRASANLLMADLDVADARRDDVRQISAAADRAAALTRQLLAFSRKQILKPRVLSLGSVVENIRPMITRLIGEDVVVETRLSTNVGNIMADAGQLEQVLINLAVNARDAMPNGGRLIIETSEVRLDAQLASAHSANDDVVVLPGTYAMLAVRDTGCGMTADVSARVFEPFFTTKPAGKGTGLGLPMAYGIVKQSGGHIRVDSEPDRGTTFELYFPVLDRNAAPAIDAAPAALPRGTETVLLVEDEASLRQLTRRILERQGYTVLESHNGRHALESATQFDRPIDLVLTDVIMPELGGRELVERLRAVRPNTAVIYMSGYTDDDVLHRELFELESQFVQKPFVPDELVQLVRAALDKR